MIRCNKIKHIFDPRDHDTPVWMKEYAQLPYPVLLDNENIRIYFASRPFKESKGNYTSNTGFIEVNPDDFEILKISDEPILNLGKSGAFDEHGLMTSSVIQTDGEWRAYYTGWFRLSSVPYSMSIGVAKSDDGITFNRYGEGPILGVSLNEPYLTSGPIVKYIDGQYHMWYLMGVKWLKTNEKHEPVYKLTHATSKDGLNWYRESREIMESKYEDECQVSFALFQKEDLYHSIFAYRKPLDFRDNSKNSYRLGYAYSKDLKHWIRDDSQIDIDVSESGWDSEMIAYPQVLELRDKIFLFYCGNGFGYTGFGVADLIID